MAQGGTNLAETNKSVRSKADTHEHCKQVVDLLARIGDKWTVMVVGILARRGTLRYNEILRAVEGISQRMLTLTLKGLVEDGLVRRTMYSTIPPRVDYDLTALGRKLVVPLQSLYDWALEHRADVIAAREISAARKGEEALRRATIFAPK